MLGCQHWKNMWVVSSKAANGLDIPYVGYLEVDIQVLGLWLVKTLLAHYSSAMFRPTGDECHQRLLSRVICPTGGSFIFPL